MKENPLNLDQDVHHNIGQRVHIDMTIAIKWNAM